MQILQVDQQVTHTTLDPNPKYDPGWGSGERWQACGTERVNTGNILSGIANAQSVTVYI